MGPIDGFWHIANFFAPALGVGTLASALCKLLWRRELAAVAWRRLALWATTGGAMASIAGLAAFGRDGRLATYALLVLASALALWWAGFVRR
ncbi:MAG TPA: hypothetical protein VFQ16_06445 [Burkholderiaceae bacterium]|nr:hypothetical protein [Burkholderiaceae bacterium]